MTNAAGMFHIAFSPDGRLGVVAYLRPKNLLPLAHVEHGWAFGDSLLLFGADVPGTISVPLDEIDRYFAMPFGVAITPDKSKIYVSTSGSDSVTVISVSRLLTFVSARGGSFANDLSASSNYVVARIAVGRNPRGIALSPDGRRLYVANRLDDTIGVIDTGTDSIIATLDLGGPGTLRPSGAASSSSTRRPMPSRGSSVVKTVTSMPPTMVCNGTWNPMASEGTSSITVRSRTSPELNLSSGMGKTPIFQPSADHERRDTSIALKAIAPKSWPI